MKNGKHRTWQFKFDLLPAEEDAIDEVVEAVMSAAEADFIAFSDNDKQT